MTAKIIDLGLAKVVDEAGSQTTISATRGLCRNTGVRQSGTICQEASVDIRSDLYSLGVSLWQMLTGHVPFQGLACRGDVSTSARCRCRLSNSKVFRSRSSASLKCSSIKIPGGVFRHRPNF